MIDELLEKIINEKTGDVKIHLTNIAEAKDENVIREEIEKIVKCDATIECINSVVKPHISTYRKGLRNLP